LRTVRTFRRWDCIDARQRERAKGARFAACTSLLSSPCQYGPAQKRGFFGYSRGVHCTDRLLAGGKRIRTAGPTYDGYAFQNTFAPPRTAHRLKADPLGSEGRPTVRNHFPPPAGPSLAAIRSCRSITVAQPQARMTRALCDQRWFVVTPIARGPSGRRGSCAASIVHGGQ